MSYGEALSQHQPGLTESHTHIRLLKIEHVFNALSNCHAGSGDLWKVHKVNYTLRHALCSAASALYPFYRVSLLTKSMWSKYSIIALICSSLCTDYNYTLIRASRPFALLYIAKIGRLCELSMFLLTLGWCYLTPGWVVFFVAAVVVLSPLPLYHLILWLYLVDLVPWLIKRSWNLL